VIVDPAVRLPKSASRLSRPSLAWAICEASAASPQAFRKSLALPTPADKPGMRHGRSHGRALAVFVALVVLLPLLAFAMVSQHRGQTTNADRTLSFAASEQAANVSDYFGRSRALTQILAKNPSFAEFYATPGRRTKKIEAQIRSVREANEALAHLETLFPGSIGEACFIDASGPENARAVKGRIESIKNLSPDETGASFFAPTFALRSDQVYQSQPYVSPDTNEWVIANSSPIELPGRSTPAIVHFEITLESLRRSAAALSKDADILIVNARSGEVVVDTRYPYVGKERPAGLRAVRGGVATLPHAASLGKRGLFTLDGHRVAYQRLERKGENANKWIVVARSRSVAAGWLGTISLWQVLLLVMIALAIPIVFFGWRRAQTDLTRAANTDSLTGLGNRRRLSAKLQDAIPAASADHPVLLAMYDLDGFKLYNDTYGHPAGDALLVRLSHRLSDSLSGIADAYRMGGDEFCIVAQLTVPGDGFHVAAQAADSLHEHGEGFTVSASYGAVLLPTETSDSTEALRLADQRMYARKSSSRLSAPRQTTDVLLQMTAERNADLGEHVTSVTELATEVATTLGLSPEQVDDVKRASALHDIGKLAIPEDILEKSEPLTAEEWEFVRQHTVIGQRILAAAPSLASCGKIVRSSHECWDGSGYPDGLVGEEIPLEARIIFACDAFEAMTSDRPYREGRHVEDALAELRRCAGTQFDPGVVRALVAELERQLQRSPSR
jgi:diguanylate cyclase (GGDEF)-like protein